MNIIEAALALPSEFPKVTTEFAPVGMHIDERSESHTVTKLDPRSGAAESVKVTYKFSSSHARLTQIDVNHNYVSVGQDWSIAIQAKRDESGLWDTQALVRKMDKPFVTRDQQEIANLLQDMESFVANL